MRRLLAASVLLCGSLCAQTTTWVTSLGSQGSKYTPAVTDARGMQFTNLTSGDLVITEIGRYVHTGNNQTHRLSIYNTDATPVEQAFVVVDCNGAPGAAFLYGTLNVSYTLAAGETCYIVSSETSGGDDLRDSNSKLNTTGVAAFRGAYIDGTGAHVIGVAGGCIGPLSIKYQDIAAGWTKNGTTYTTDGSQWAVQSAIDDADPGDTVEVPAGSFTWGYNASYISLNKQASLLGAGSASTTIIVPSTGPTGTNGVVRITAAATVGGFTMSPATGLTTGLNAGTASGWRITDVTYNSLNSTGAAAYFVYVGEVYGLIDNCTVNTGGGADEPIFVRGPTDSWQTAQSMGTVNAVYVEDCTFTSNGYPDANANARVVFRFCTFTGNNKVDGHGLASNTPARGVRHVEAYYNNWTSSTANITALELRGGTGMVFGNTSATSSGQRNYLDDYGYLGTWSNFGFVYQTPNNYPIGYQIGTGMDVTLNATDITAYQMVKIATVGTTDYTLIGAANNNVGTQFIATGAGSGTGTVTTTPAGTEPMYVFNNTVNGSPWARTLNNIPAGAIAVYRTQTGNPAATFIESDIIQKNRDFFASSGFDGTFTFDGSEGVGVGTQAQLEAITGTLAGVGFWVTDEGSWNTELSPNTSGQLYVWDGDSWELYYTPYTYPHPLQNDPPAVSSASVSTDGAQLVIVFTQSCTTGAGGNGGMTVTASGGAATLTYDSGSGSDIYTYDISRTVSAGESLTLAYVQPGNGIEATDDQVDLPSFSDQAVTNQSTVSATQASTFGGAIIGGGF